MARDDDLIARLAEPDFWPLYAFEEEAEDADEDEVLRAQFLLDRGLGLELEFEPDISYVNLALMAPELAEAETVGWDDTAHFHPHVMPWSELDLLCRAAALHDPVAVRHPGPMLALLLRFAFLTEDDDLDTVTPLVDAGFAAVRPSAEADGTTPRALRPETRDWFDLRDLRGTGIEWQSRPDGRTAVTQRDDDGMPLYSLREPESAEFPFAAWHELLTRATDLLGAVRNDPTLHTPDVRAALDRCAEPDGHEHLAPLASALHRAGFENTALLRALSRPVAVAEAAWAVETLAGLRQGELVAAWFGAGPPAAARSWRLSLTLPAAGQPWCFAQEFTGELSAALQAAGLGRAETGVSTSIPGDDGGYVHQATQLHVLIRDDLPGGVGLISRLLHQRHAAETAVLKHGMKPYAPIPLTGPSV